MLGSVGVLVA